MRITVSIDSKLRARLSDLPDDIVSDIKSFLTISNGARVKAVELGQWGADDMPETIELWQQDNGTIVMPRGFASFLRGGLESRGIEVAWDDRTSAPSISLGELMNATSPSLHGYQEAALAEVLRQRVGVLEAPTAGGKTLIGLDIWRRAGLTGLILTEKTSLLEQWREKAMEHLGVEAGIIGDGSWDERPLTIAMLQTLYRRRDELDRTGWWRRWGLTEVDECHHAVSDSYREVIDRSTSRLLLGFTATALGGEWKQPILTALLGPIVHSVSPEELRRQGVRVTPLIKVVKTKFRWAPNPQEEKLVDSRAIYRHILKAFEQDSDRLDLIAATIASQPSSTAQLVLCKRLEYLDHIEHRLVDGGYDHDRIFKLRGAENRDQKQAVAEQANSEGSCVILATVADEGTDIPRLDRLHLTWPQRKSLTITQQIGRVLRRHPEKREAIIFDYADFEQPTLRSQFYARLKVYRAAGYPTEGLG